MRVLPISQQNYKKNKTSFGTQVKIINNLPKLLQQHEDLVPIFYGIKNSIPDLEKNGHVNTLLLKFNLEKNYIGEFINMLAELHIPKKGRIIKTKVDSSDKYEFIKYNKDNGLLEPRNGLMNLIVQTNDNLYSDWQKGKLNYLQPQIQLELAKKYSQGLIDLIYNRFLNADAKTVIDSKIPTLWKNHHEVGKYFVKIDEALEEIKNYNDGSILNVSISETKHKISKTSTLDLNMELLGTTVDPKGKIVRTKTHSTVRLFNVDKDLNVLKTDEGKLFQISDLNDPNVLKKTILKKYEAIKKDSILNNS